MVIVLTLLGVALIGAVAYGESPKLVKLKRCGYVNATYGRSALYPWHMSCPAARKVVVASDDPHAQVIVLAFAEEVVRVDGYSRYWVCGGDMGEYNCAYPYRRRKINGQQVNRGPLTQRVVYETCSLVGGTCPKTIEVGNPSVP
jgi:hypothetical protein